ncbi:site-2 protease family protein [Aquibacillus kalidii]|uniref:site-2 protease family protein n=1 Tax=Aquibacillus kalidii TaxID=2762597 RepID=UPI001C99B3AC|nr:site-2 protease family protein [Aquibacillus kalidii]
MCLVLVIGPLGTIIHETGHLLGALLGKADKAYLRIGIGQRVSKFEMKKVTIEFNRLFFIGGLTSSEKENSSFTKKEGAFIILCGPLANLIVATIIQSISIENLYLSLFMMFNYWLAFINIIPFKTRNRQSDGYQFIKLVFCWKNGDIFNEK